MQIGYQVNERDTESEWTDGADTDVDCGERGVMRVERANPL